MLEIIFELQEKQSFLPFPTAQCPSPPSFKDFWLPLKSRVWVPYSFFPDLDLDWSPTSNAGSGSGSGKNEYGSESRALMTKN
jgi:hypothetical protein